MEQDGIDLLFRQRTDAIQTIVDLNTSYRWRLHLAKTLLAQVENEKPTNSVNIVKATVLHAEIAFLKDACYKCAVKMSEMSTSSFT